MCVACCTITLVACDPVSLLLGYLPVCDHSNLDHYIPASGCMCQFLRHLLIAAVIIGMFTVIDSFLNDFSNQMVFHHQEHNIDDNW